MLISQVRRTAKRLNCADHRATNESFRPEGAAQRVALPKARIGVKRSSVLLGAQPGPVSRHPSLVGCIHGADGDYFRPRTGCNRGAFGVFAAASAEIRCCTHRFRCAPKIYRESPVMISASTTRLLPQCRSTTAPTHSTNLPPRSCPLTWKG
jgi:hypothetical protein